MLSMDPDHKNKYGVDHVYCNTTENAYIRANPAANDTFALLKENKQMKSMILLHLDLIQEQSDQLITKDKVIAQLKEENSNLKMRLQRMERRAPFKYSKNNDQTLVITNNPKNETLLEISHAVPLVASVEDISVSTLNTPTPDNKYKICEEVFSNQSIIGKQNGKFISKIVLQRVPGLDNLLNKDENEVQDPDTEHKQLVKIEDTSSQDVPTKDEISIQNDTEDSFSCTSADQELHLQRTNKTMKRFGFMTTKVPYKTREWENEKWNEEINKDEKEALQSDKPNLEIPKWTIKEFTGLYSIEGTEDLSDETFLKRHARFEQDEKKRKKWDVQRIREQRTIERLKRRHCKEELLEAERENQELCSFYPSPDQIQFIHVAEELPVQAFGESIPKLKSGNFQLPWKSNKSQADDISHSTTKFIFLQKRQRSYSQNTPSRGRRLHRKSQSKTKT